MKHILKFHREITPLIKDDCFLVFDRIKDDFDFPIHYHPEYEINFIKNGKGVRRIVGDHVEEIDDIELVFVGPNLYHGWEMNNCKGKKIHEITIQFHNNLFDELLLSKRIMKSIKEMFERSIHGILFSKKTATDLYERMSKLLILNGIDYFLEITSILDEMANSNDQRLLSSFTIDNSKFEDNDKMKLVYEFVQKNFADKITLDDASKIAMMSPITFNRFIKKRTGKTFINYLNDIRVGNSSRWLVESELSISEIAFKSGFNNIANFNRIFKSLKKTTPSQYREKFYGIKKYL